MAGHRTALIYGYTPNLLGFCGPKEILEKKIISEFITGKEIPETKIRKIIESFKSACSYYRLIAAANGVKDPFDEKVVRAYWIGNELLKKVKSEDFTNMVKERFLLRGIPNGSFPHHSFHVLNVGTLAGKLADNLLDFCLIKWGRVVEIKNNKIVIDNYRPLKKGEGKFYLGAAIKKEILWNKILLPKLEMGDWVSVHWENAIEKLNNEGLENLKKYTEINLQAHSKR